MIVRARVITHSFVLCKKKIVRKISNKNDEKSTYSLSQCLKKSDEKARPYKEKYRKEKR